MKDVPLSRLPRTLREAYRDTNVRSQLERFQHWQEQSERRIGSDGQYDHTETVDNYYDLLSELMQFGWNESLHFAPLSPSETLDESIVRHQRLLIEKLELQKGMRVIDVGCGVGGPMRRVAKESGATVLCLNNNEQQLKKAKRLNVEHDVDHLAEYLKCNFMDMSALEPESFDAAYAIESTCYAPDKERAFAEIFRLLKPGGLFWGQEMCLTNTFSSDDDEHCAIAKEIQYTLALSQMFSFAEVNQALESVGFAVVESQDREVQSGPSTPWYQPMLGKTASLRALRSIPMGRSLMIAGTRLTEMIGIIPKGTSAVVKFADRIAYAYVSGGQAGIFTPLYCFLARKPE